MGKQSLQKRSHAIKKQETKQSKHHEQDFKFNRNLTGYELATTLKAELDKREIDPSNVLIRHFTSKRLALALQTGTDRDKSSNTSFFRDDQEKETMRAYGIFDRGGVTFVSPLTNYLTGGKDAPDSWDRVYVLYHKNLLYKLGTRSNGLHTFLVPPQKAVLGFIHDLGTIQLAHPTNASPPAPL